MKKVSYLLAILFAISLAYPVQAKTSPKAAKSSAVEKSEKKQAKKERPKEARRAKDFAPYSQTELYTRVWRKMRATSRDKAQIIIVQTGLAKAGYRIHIDGIFGKETQGVLRLFQEARGIHADGIWADRETAKYLNPIVNPTFANRVIKPIFSKVKNRVDNRWHALEQTLEQALANGSRFTAYWKGEGDGDTDEGKSVSGLPLGYSSTEVAGVCAVNPEKIRLGSRVRVVNEKTGEAKNYIAGDIGDDVFSEKASAGRLLVIDTFGRHEVRGKVTVTLYTGETPFMDLPSRVQKQFVNLKNWKTGTLRLSSSVEEQPKFASSH